MDDVINDLAADPDEATFADLLVAEEEWLRAEFDAIVAAEEWGLGDAGPAGARYATPITRHTGLVPVDIHAGMAAAEVVTLNLTGALLGCQWTDPSGLRSTF